VCAGLCVLSASPAAAGNLALDYVCARHTPDGVETQNADCPADKAFVCRRRQRGSSQMLIYKARGDSNTLLISRQRSKERLLISKDVFFYSERRPKCLCQPYTVVQIASFGYK
jgi:hypothetical protein